MLDNEHKNVLRDTRLAVSAYAKDPSDRNAARVQFSLRMPKELELSMWQEHFEKWLRSAPAQEKP